MVNAVRMEQRKRSLLLIAAASVWAPQLGAQVHMNRLQPRTKHLDERNIAASLSIRHLYVLHSAMRTALGNEFK